MLYSSSIQIDPYSQILLLFLDRLSIIFNTGKSNAKNTNFFYKIFYELLIWLVVISKWKSDVNGGSKWKPIKS